MKVRELKAFLREKEVYVDDCFDMDAPLACRHVAMPAARLIQRAAATQETWAEPEKPTAAADGELSEVEKAWQRLGCQGSCKDLTRFVE